MNTLPLFYYPSTTVLVDDDALFLNSVSLLFRDESLVKAFNSPQEGLQFFENYEPLLPNFNFIRATIDSDHYDRLNHLPVDLKINAFKQLRSISERHSEISVLITDYNMPEINGIDFCRKLQSLPMKKILLTGEADYTQAVSAFNEGIIDCFIPKSSENIANDVAFYVTKLSQDYFSEVTRPFLRYLETDYLLALSDPEFISFFNDWCFAHHIREYYLIDKNGNFLLVDEQGNHSYFIVHTERTLNQFTELHSDDVDGLLFIRATTLREKIPFFGEGVESWDLSSHQWASCFHSPQIFQGRERYYWMVVNK